jgi:hypothetical protein
VLETGVGVRARAAVKTALAGTVLVSSHKSCYCIACENHNTDDESNSAVEGAVVVTRNGTISSSGDKACLKRTCVRAPPLAKVGSMTASNGRDSMVMVRDIYAIGAQRHLSYHTALCDQN